MNQSVKGVLDVSVWVMLWGTAGQVITVVVYGVAAVVLAVKLSGRFLKPQE